MKIKAVTYNVCHCRDYSVSTKGDIPVNIEKHGRYLQKINADIVALNEVFFQGIQETYNNQTEKLSKIAEYPYYVESVGQELSFATIGNAILSKYPIEDVEKISVLAPTEDERRKGENKWYEDRAILSIVVNVNGEKVRVMTTHFGLNMLEQERMVNTLIPLIENSKFPIILMGDFNTQPHTDILLPIYEKLKSCADEKGNTEFTFSSFNPHGTIDYIFVSKGAKVKEFLVRTEILSDHRACQADIEI